MKSLYESQEHQQIRTVRQEDKTAARLGEITGDRAVRILTDTLTRGERRERRKLAGIQKKPRIFRGENTLDLKPEKIDNRTLLESLRLDAIQQFLSELGEVTVTKSSDEVYSASIAGVALKNKRLEQENDWLRREITGGNSDEAVRNYFKNAATPGTSALKGEDEYDWNLDELNFIRRDVISLGERKEKIERIDDLFHIYYL